MKVIQENPTIVQSSWEDTPLGRTCYLISAVLINRKPRILMVNVTIANSDLDQSTPEQIKNSEKVVLKSRLEDCNDDIRKCNF